MSNDKIHKSEEEKRRKIAFDILNAKKDAEDGDDEDSDQNFIKQDGSELPRKDAGVLPESNQQRNLDRETGGLEARKRKLKHIEDAWDRRYKEIVHMIEDTQDLNNASKSTRDQSFIHQVKQRNKHKKSHGDVGEKIGKIGFVEGVNKMRKARLDKSEPFGGKHGGYSF